MNKSLTSLLLFLFPLLSLAQTEPTNSEVKQEIRDFSLLYGITRYFHPADESVNLDWETFAVWGVEELLKEEKSAQDIYGPIFPNIKFQTGDSLALQTNQASSNSSKTMFWQHQGMGLGSIYKDYKSSRITGNQKLLFHEKLKSGTSCKLLLSSGKTAIIPLALVENGRRTNRSKAQKKTWNQLQEKLKTRSLKGFSGDDLSTRLAGIVIATNALNHFFPYEINTKNGLDLLDRGIEYAFSANNEWEFLQSLRALLSQLHDGHASVMHKKHTPTGRLPFEVIWQDNLAFILFASNNAGIKAGDQLLEINGVQVMEAFAKAGMRISGSVQWKRQKANWLVAAGNPGDKVSLKINRNGEILEKETLLGSGLPRLAQHKPQTEEIAPEVWYLNMTSLSYPKLLEAIKLRNTAKAWVFDLRLHPANNHQLLSHLLKEADTSKWISLPQLMQPSERPFPGEKVGWNLQPALPKIKGEVIFLTSHSSISYCESVIGMIKHYQLGTIVGQRTAGANGSTNGFKLPGAYTLRFTGSEVTLPNGSSYFGAGIPEDIEIDFNEKMLREGKDPWIEISLNFLRKKGIVE